jgi:hypothetical protein
MVGQGDQGLRWSAWTPEEEVVLVNRVTKAWGGGGTHAALGGSRVQEGWGWRGKYADGAGSSGVEHENLCGSDRWSVIPYVHGESCYIVVCVLFKPGDP